MEGLDGDENLRLRGFHCAIESYQRRGVAWSLFNG